jgi:heme-degrading monooxygenase HmoA
MLAQLPPPPYYAVIFTSVRLSATQGDGYELTADRMVDLASAQPGFLGIESARQAVGITVSYWTSLAAIQAWRQQAEHRQAQRHGRARWYHSFSVRICLVERAYEWSSSELVL